MLLLVTQRRGGLGRGDVGGQGCLHARPLWRCECVGARVRGCVCGCGGLLATLCASMCPLWCFLHLRMSVSVFLLLFAQLICASMCPLWWFLHAYVRVILHAYVRACACGDVLPS